MHRVHLFIPCYIDQLFPQVGIATVNILESLGCEVIYPEEQTCCGQPAFNSGYFEETVPLADHFLNTFRSAEFIVAPSGSCISMTRNLYGMLNLPDNLKELWQSLRPKMFELSQFLVHVLGLENWEGFFPHRVTYHDSCHLLRELGVRDEPRRLLRGIAGIEFREMFRSDTCCGFGGTFSVKMEPISIAMMENKAQWIQESGAEYVVAGDASCLMHMEGYLKKHRIPVRTMHLAELLWQARENNRETDRGR